jgi:hypothetical protein
VETNAGNKRDSFGRYECKDRALKNF